jgi:hypothetical protein
VQDGIGIQIMELNPVCEKKFAEEFMQRKRKPLENESKKEYPESRGLMTHKYRGSQQSSREVKPKFIDSTQREPKDIYKP